MKKLISVDINFVSPVAAIMKLSSVFLDEILSCSVVCGGEYISITRIKRNMSVMIEWLHIGRGKYVQYLASRKGNQ